MYIKVPSEIQQYWKGRLVPTEESILVWENKNKEQGRRVKGDLQLGNFNLPLVSIGIPDVWKLQDLYPKGKIPRSIAVKLGEADYYFVRLACSFRPQYKEIAIENARFCLFFQPTQGELPVAYDVHPFLIEKEVKKNAKFSLNPTLKFMQMEASAGEFEFGFEYNELIPIVSATGVMEANPAWEYKEAPGYSIQGSKLMHILMRVPKGLHPILASATIDAKLRAYGSILNAVFGLEETKAGAHLSMLLVD
jgi:hypothetical protein